MKLKYLGSCSVCLRPIDAGKEAQWAKDMGVRHISCGKKADQIEELKKKSFEALILNLPIVNKPSTFFLLASSPTSL